MSDIVGHTDLRHRPLTSLAISGHEDPVLALIDTGFNGHLLTNQLVADQLGFVFPGIEITVDLAGHTARRFQVANGRIEWFGKTREVPVLVSGDLPPATAAADEPLVLIGTALLHPHKLIIDFGRGGVMLSQAE